jgi:hypothetical protein
LLICKSNYKDAKTSDHMQIQSKQQQQQQQQAKRKRCLHQNQAED